MCVCREEKREKQGGNQYFFTDHVTARESIYIDHYGAPDPIFPLQRIFSFVLSNPAWIECNVLFWSFFDDVRLIAICERSLSPY